jgi:hypothetical protein
MICLCVLPGYNVPATRFHSRCISNRGRLRLKDTGFAPGITPVESAYSLVGLPMLKRRLLRLRPQIRLASLPTGEGFVVSLLRRRLLHGGGDQAIG